MKSLRNLAIVIICLAVISAILSVIGTFFLVAIADIRPRSFANFSVICLLLSMNVLLLDKKS